MYSLNSFDQNWTDNNDNNIGYYFAICETCFWTATIFIQLKNRTNMIILVSHKRSIITCPIYSSKNISMVSIPIHWNDTNKMQLPMLTINQYNH
jgi:hypothetical protein